VEATMIEIDSAEAPIYSRGANLLTVALTLKGDPDDIWATIFETGAKGPNGPTYELEKNGPNGRAYVTLQLMWNTHYDEAKLRLAKLADFVDAVGQEYAQRMEAFAGLEGALTRYVGTPQESNQ
jgi:hypothetical protein